MSDKKKNGFTIIEVVLVLAIAGLIFLMVFIALPALQANQRDTSRKNDVGIVMTAIASYSSNNRGSLPPIGTAIGGTGNTAFSSYVSNLSANTTKVVVSGPQPSAFTPADGEIDIVNGAICGSTANIPSQGTSRQSAVIVKLESGGGAYYCQNN